MPSNQTSPTHHFQQATSDLTIAQQGAHLLSWRVNGIEQLYLSPLAASDGATPIRGGVPVCFPQFNLRGALAKHGFARTAAWTQLADALHPTFELCSNAQTRQLWPHDFRMTLAYVAVDRTLTLHWSVRNTGDTAFDWTGALHTYLAVSDIDRVTLHGLQGQTCWDALSGETFTESSAALSLAGEFDRVFDAAPGAATLALHDGERRVLISQSSSLAHTVVWNPGLDRCAQISDLPADGYRHFLCVEAAQVLTPITVLAGDTWTGWQRLVVSK